MERRYLDDATSPIDNHGGRAPLRRDEQQWVLDWIIQQTGKTYHFQGDGRGDLPKSVRTHAMIPKHLAQEGARLERIAGSLAERGNSISAMNFYFDACLKYAKAQHPVFELSDQKRHLYEAVRRCYDGVREHAPYRIERVEIPWENGTSVVGHLHLIAGDEPRPLMFYIPGCDSFKEAYPHPLWNFAHQRGMHIFSFDGPGQAEANLQGIRLTADNYEVAASVALDSLIDRSDIDADAVVVYGNSFGAFWGMRFAAHDHRIKAIAATQASLCEKYIHMDLESPRWKQLMAFLSQAGHETELDSVMDAMTMEGYMGRIECPVLMTVGEYDPRAPLDETLTLFDELQVPATLWVMVDQHHLLSLGDKGGPQWARASHGIVTDWLNERLAGVDMPEERQVVRVRGDDGPYQRSARPARNWFDE